VNSSPLRGPFVTESTHRVPPDPPADLRVLSSEVWKLGDASSPYPLKQPNLLRMRLNTNCWSSSPPGSALELIPCGSVRATASYFRAGHLLLDSRTRSLELERQI
jgi:hypothetical protein